LSTDAQFPGWARGLFSPKRYKVLYGGRGSGKSWAVARALLLRCAMQPTRVLCAREVQRSIRDSVHRLLSDQIQNLGLAGKFEVLDQEIRGKNGSLIVFSGLSQHTVDSIKSYEGIDLVWVEEAQAVSKRSWDVLTPTIRKAESEIWMSLNPELETDETFARFIKTERADAWVQKVNFTENPWFGGALEGERAHAQATMSAADYGHIWEGKCRPAVAGAIYFDEIASAESAGRVGRFPVDPMLKVHRVWDMGWNDAMAIILAQRNGSALTAVGYVTGTRRTVADYIADFKGDAYRGWNWGSDFLPHDGFAKHRQTGKSDADVLRGLGCTVAQTPNVEVEQGIRQARMVFPRVAFDAAGCASKDHELPGLVECLKRYRRRINQTTQTPEGPLHDVHSNGADAFRYLALVADQLSNEDWGALTYPDMNYV
jgi:phage terminase large subunit